MNNLKRYHAFIIALVFAFLPVILLCIPGLRAYVFETWHVAAFYSSIIIIMYLTGTFIVIFSFIEISKCVSVLRNKNAQKHSYLLGDANKIVFSASHGLDDDTVATLYESMDNSVNRKQNQSLAGVMTCANLSTMIGLLGTFAGLSMTIASVITLLEKSQITGGNEADTLGIIVSVVSSLAEPLKGMNTAFVSSIYGVVSAILLNVMCSFLRGEFTRLAIDLRNARLDFVRECHERSKTSAIGKTKTLRLITDLDDVIKEFKAGMFGFQERLTNAFDTSNNMLNSLLNCTVEGASKTEMFNDALIAAVHRQVEQLQHIDQGITSNHSALLGIEKEIGASTQALVNQETHLAALTESQSLLQTSQLQLMSTVESQRGTLDELLASQAQTHHAVLEVNDGIGHLDANVGELHTVAERHFSEQASLLDGISNAVETAERVNLDRHHETVATLDSQSQTFEPLLGQIAGMHRNLQKEINVLKEKKSHE